MEESGKSTGKDVELPIDKGPTIGIRFIITGLLFLNLTIGYSMRVNLSVAIVAMLDNTTTQNPDIPTYDWTNKDIILSSFYWGYILLQIFAGELGNKYGTKWLLFGAMFVCSSATVLTPLLADKLGSYAVMGSRMVQGMAQGFFFPSVHNLLGKWAPLSERSTMGTVAFAGPAAGTIIAMPITGYIASSWAGWPASFYFFGALGFGWMILWSVFGANSPALHSRISQAERNYIEKSLKIKENAVTPKTPFKSIFTSLPVWAFVVAMFGQNWGYSTLLTEIPSYMDGVMGYDMKDNSVLSAAPYLACFLISFIFGVMSDFLINRGYLSRLNARRLFNSLGTIVPAVALIILGFLPRDASTLSVFMLILAVGVNAGCFTGFQIVPVDMTPKFSGIVMGLGNGSSNIFSILAPLSVQYVVTDKHDVTLWRIIFLIAAAWYILSDIFFVIFLKTDVQEWDLAADGPDSRSASIKMTESYRKSMSLNYY